ncbi:hypothetical protein HPP92_013477 [Vanilla planifolia]|uniref:Uncharacterized protein n=1 Tax=Vanilla planifolia TaxID=51239 RepID=A0A835UYP0_VANPL|nr:hypothetical protein HPP92_013477 [Vanilla planifolia]
MAEFEALPPSVSSVWRSPVPFLLGGLAAMLGLVAISLIMLSYSYWQLSGYRDSGGDVPESSVAQGCDLGKDMDKMKGKSAAAFEDRVVVIMAGEHKPTFLAKPKCCPTLNSGCGDEASMPTCNGRQM